MEELHEIASAHIKGGPEELQEASEEFFDALDTDGDGEIDYEEFMSFMEEGGGYPRDLCEALFDQLDEEEDGTLDFDKISTLFYILKSGRPFCDACDNFIPGVYFTCVTCFQRPGQSFDVCLRCYKRRRWEHYHRDGVCFVDCFAMLHGMRESMLMANEPEMSNEMVLYKAPKNRRNPSTQPSSSKKLVSKGTMRKMKSALSALETAATIGSIGTTATALCTIM
ncbi:hypothetical protein Leryth_018095 [Lithospermum erythrorhizon]|nr:hypothetical protein Leryth_018095 [Lithospermum erythrorhizon]